MTGACRKTLPIQPLNSILSKPNKRHLQPQTVTKPPFNPQRSQTLFPFSQSIPNPMSIFSSSHSISIESIPKSLLHPSNPPLKIQSLPSKLPNLLLFRPITTQRLSVKPVESSSTSPGPLQPIEELPPRLQEIVKLFQEVEQPKAKYEQLLFYGRKLGALGDEFKTNDNKVQGCVSQVWVRAYLDDDKNVIFEADSDSMLTKGLAALLVIGLSGRGVKEVVRVSPDFVRLLGLQQSLTPSRNNGFLNMLKLMQKKALQLYVESEKANEGEKGNEDLGLEVKIDNVNLNVNGRSGVRSDGNSRGSGSDSGRDGSLVVEDLGLEVKNDNVNVNGSSGESFDGNSSGSGSDSGSDGSLGSRGMRIKKRLGMKLSPVELVVEDISYQHAGHAGVRGSDGETHFNVKVVSGEFEGKSMVKRHRLIYDLLQDELQNGLHALSIVAKTPSEVGGD